jgi:hypothetical protein
MQHVCCSEVDFSIRRAGRKVVVFANMSSFAMVNVARFFQQRSSAWPTAALVIGPSEDGVIG